MIVNAPVMVGRLAPEFDLPCTPTPGSNRRRASLLDYRGRWLALVFYPRDFSLVCPTELTGLDRRLDEFTRRGCDVLGVSCDLIESHEQWVQTPRARGGLEGLRFPLASDEDGAVARAYGVYLEHQHAALRGLFLIDPNGVLQYLTVHALNVGRRAENVLRILMALQTGGLCGSEWSPGDATIDPTQMLAAGSMVGHYRIEGVLGSGSFATVFRARDLDLQRTVALKVLRPGAAGTVLAEARSAAALNHPNICTVYGVEDEDGLAMIAMEYLRGQPIGRRLETGGALPPDEAAAIASQVADGLAAAHARGIVHGDLNLENVFLTRDGVAKILDFGLARLDATVPDPDQTLDYAPDATVGGSDAAAARGLFGTPSHMAPEQARGEPATARSDVFAFGLIVWELLTGRRAFSGPNVLQVLAQVRAVDPRAMAAQVPEPYRDLVAGALAVDPAERLTMAAIVDRLS